MNANGIRSYGWVALLAALAAPAACGDAGQGDDADGTAAALPLDSTARVAQVQGLAGPEAVRYDPEADVWLVANFGTGSAEDGRDGDGFISRVTADGEIEALRFMVGTDAAPLHMPRGMILKGDTLWVADVDGVHGFHRATGEQLAFVDFTAHEPGFLNDVALDDAGTVHVTDTGLGRVYRIEDGRAAIAVEDSLTGPPNGITWDPAGHWFLLAPWGGGTTLRAWDPRTGELTATVELVGGNFDGIEIVDGRVIVASQADSSIHSVWDGETTRLIRVPGRPADIGIDTRRGRVAVPYIALDRVDIWEIPEG